jgi:uncharacterized protein (DUF2235 family)
MKRIVICFDGTWSKPSDEALPAAGRVETNVCRFYESVKDQAADGTKQVKWYDEGVGTKWYDQFLGGAIGAGLEINIVQATSFSPSNTKPAMKSMFSDSAAAPTRRVAWWA